ncbi:MAG: hypothetical protein ACOCZ8_05105 [Bacteroidota bacterium]
MDIPSVAVNVSAGSVSGELKLPKGLLFKDLAKSWEPKRPGKSLEALILGLKERREDRQPEIERAQARKEVYEEQARSWKKWTLGLINPAEQKIKEEEALIEDVRRYQNAPLFNLTFKLSGEMKTAWKQLLEGFTLVSQSIRAQEVVESQGTLGRQLDLADLQFGIAKPKVCDSTQKYPQIMSQGRWQLDILPGFLMLQHAEGAQIFSWSDVQLTFRSEPFRSQKRPRDAEVTFETWQHLTDAGKKDESISDNPRVYILKMGRIQLQLDSQQKELLFSNFKCTETFSSALHAYRKAVLNDG